MSTLTGLLVGIVIGASAIVAALRIGYRQGLADAPPPTLISPAACAPLWWEPPPKTQAELRRRICSRG